MKAAETSYNPRTGAENGVVPVTDAREVHDALDRAAAAAPLVAGTAPAVGWSTGATVLTAPLAALTPGSRIFEECFGPVAVVVEYDDLPQLELALSHLQGALAGSVFPAGDDDADLTAIVELIATKVGRVAVGDWPTGVAYSWAQQHGGPWPATTHPSATSVGAAALGRFVRPVTYQSVPDSRLPMALQESNPWAVPRRVGGRPEASRVS